MSKTLRSTLEYRKSVRKFDKEQISEEQLQRILESANAAPVAMRLYDNLKIIVIQNSDLLDELNQNAVDIFRESKGIDRKTAVFDAQTLIIIAAKCTNEDARIGLYCTGACMLENMILAATELELGNVYLAGVTVALNYNKKLKRKVSIPEDYEAISAVAIGKTDVPFTKRDLSIPRFTVERIQ